MGDSYSDIASSFAKYTNWSLCVFPLCAVLEPAAHLDPGPEGHNIYGGVGHSLALSSVPLDTQATLQRLEGEGGKGGERTLLHCRRLMVAYLAGANRHGK